MIIAGFSAYSRVLDFARFRQIADAVGAYLLVDMAHVAGLVAAGVYPNPVPYADVVTTTTHKTLRGPRGGLILARANEEITKKLNSMVFPGTQGGPLMHVIAAKAVAFLEALQPEFRDYQQQVVANARAMAGASSSAATRSSPAAPTITCSCSTSPTRTITGKEADAALGKAHITVNKNAVPNDPRPPMVTSGMRIGTPAVTTRGFKEAEVAQIADWIADVLDAHERRGRDREARAAVREHVPALSGVRLTERGLTASRQEARRCTVPSARIEETKVNDSRLAAEGAQIRRRRECLRCGERFTTFETAELVMPLVVKSDATREPFDEAKLRSGMVKALEKRPVGRSKPSKRP